MGTREEIENMIARLGGPKTVPKGRGRRRMVANKDGAK